MLRGTATGPRPLADVRVVLHRVSPDSAGPLDSVLTDRRGRYAFRYQPFGSTDAVYFVSASHHGIAYFTPPLRAPVVRGDEALITVFDTTSGPVRVRVVGHHVVIGQPDAGGRREVVEVFELGNDSSVTLVSQGAAKPTWTAPLPVGAENPRVNPSGEIAPNTVLFADGRVQLLAPLSPGARQLAYVYDLRRQALPLSMVIDQPNDVLEVLVEESRSTVSGARLAEVEPVTTSGRTFRRFLAQAVPANSVVHVEVPFVVGEVRTRWLRTMAVTCVAAMLAAILVAFRRRRRVAPMRAVSTDAARPASPSELLLAEITSLDARYEQLAAPSAAERVQYEEARAVLKSRLAAELAGERGQA